MEPADFNRVTAFERIFIRRRRNRMKTGLGGPPEVRRSGKIDDVFAITLSGGGIRAASFSLGALQALDAFGMIRRADYLSTVSGGGYLGAGMVAAMSRNKGHFPYSVTGEQAAGRNTATAEPISTDMRDSEAVSHLRDHSKYLVPHGISDVLLSLSVLARGLAVNFMFVLSVIVTLATITIAANPTVEYLGHSAAIDLWKVSGRAYADWPLPERFPLTLIFGCILGLHLVTWGITRSYRDSGGQDARQTWGSRVTQILGAVTLSCAVFEAQGPVLEWLAKKLLAPATDGDFIAHYWNVIVVILSAVLTFVTGFRKSFEEWISKAPTSSSLMVKMRAILSRLALYAAGLILPLLIYFGYLAITLWGIASCGCNRANCSHEWPSAFRFGPSFLTNEYITWVLALPAFVIAVVATRFLLRTQDGQDTWALLLKRLGALKLKDYIYVGIGAAILAVLIFVAKVTRADGEQFAQHAQAYSVLWNFIAASVSIILITWTFSENANSLHALYRDRLNVAFRYSGDPECENPLKLQQIDQYAPYLVVNATLNARMAATTDAAKPKENLRSGRIAGVLLSLKNFICSKFGRKSLATERTDRQDEKQVQLPPNPVKRGRNAEFFFFSKYFVGSESTKYVPSIKYPKLDLSYAVAISGAAFSSNMGRANITALTPTLALLNVRLGYWLDNPLYRFKSIAELPETLPWHDFLRSYFMAEAFGLLRTDSSKIYLTDGGHLDNLGLYQMLRRGCKYIIVVDAEADPELNCGALVDVQRFARIDLGVRIDIDLTGIQKAGASRAASPKDEDGKTNKGKHVDKSDPIHDCHFAVGEIDYGLKEKGTLVYVKAVMTGDEPDYVLDYERRYPAFPHESTSDQFFSEEQMEAYRALGFHAMRRAMTEKLPTQPLSTASQLVEKRISAMKRTLEIDKQSLD